MILSVILAVFLILAGGPSLAATSVASSCSQADVASALTASNAGDTVEIPNGSCAWSSGVSYSQRLIRAQNYTPTSGGDTTRNVIITNNVNGPLFSLSTGDTYHTGLAGIRINQGSTVSNHISVSGSGTKVALINDMWFQSSSDRFGNAGDVTMLHFHGIGGVVWNSMIDGRDAGTGGAAVRGAAGSHILVRSSRNWNTASTMGDADTNGNVNVYFEDCSFIYTAQTPDTDTGGRVVIRYSYLNGVTGLTHGPANQDTAGRSIEYYNNTFDATDLGLGSPLRNHEARYLWFRAGTGVMTDNVINDTTYPQEYGSMNSLSIGDNGAPDGTYLIPRQPGAGYDGVNDVSDPIYSWNNTGARAYNWSYQNQPGGWQSYVVEGRDVFVNDGAKPGYVKYTYPHPARSTVESTTADYTITFAGQSTDVCTISFTTEAVSVDGTFALADGDITAFACTITATSPNLELDKNDLQYPVGLDYTVSGGKVVALDLQTKTSNELQIGSAIAGRVGSLWQIFGEGTALAGSSNTITIGDVQ